ncbi:invasion associated locus B family protein [Pseudooceanicola aestuarii]|uniref:invasion associated locus B family protein n=1 Tax=Pseudooceanicola aestuarii TaxID=2697319 RepID=UPI0013D00535|nr:invasion associated locus B family protein [Pseudooceanicola aestuarii]
MTISNTIGAALAALLLTTAAVSAQDAAATETAPQADSGAAAGTGPALTMGEDPDADPTLGQPYVKEEIGDWQLQCIRTEEGEDPCQLYQLLQDEDGNSVAEFSLFRVPEGSQATAGATVIVPLETLLTADLSLGVDGSKGKKYRFAFCNQIGCFARIGLTADDIASFRNGKEANLTIVPVAAPDVKVRLNLSLIGFTAGFEKVSVVAQ